MPTSSPGGGPTPGGASLAALVDRKYADQFAADLLAAPLAARHGLSPAKADLLYQALGITTIGELAAHRFVRAAAEIAAEAAD